MAKWLNSKIGGKLTESDLSATEDEAFRKLNGALQKHKEKGRREKDGWDDKRMRPYWDVLDENGEVVATYWLSAENEGSSAR